MGRPRHVKPARTGTRRRDFIQRSGASVLGAVAAAQWLPLGAEAADTATPFQHGVASGDPLADRVILWTRVTPPAPRAAIAVAWIVATDPALTRIVLRGSAKTNLARDNTVKVDAIGLRPATTYYYQFSAEGATSPVGRTRTLPSGPTTSLRMAVVSCSNHAYGYFNAYGRIARRADLDLVMHLGDYLYEYGAGQYGSARAPEPANEIVTLADYRARHAQYKRDADSQAMHRQHPLVAIWDDHETANNSWTGGAENHQPATEGDWNARVAAALQAYDEWMPVRPVEIGNPRKNNRFYTYGDLADLIMLEERLTGRSEQLLTSAHPTPFGAGFAQTDPGYGDPNRRMLAADEEVWLSDRLRTTPARWKLLGQGVMFAQLKGVAAANAAGGGFFLNSDQWDGYQPARDRIYDVLKGDATHPAVNDVVILTGDIHSSWAADLTQDPNNPNVATGGYDPATGAGSRAVEFVGTSVSSPGIDSDTTGAIAGALRSINPHFKYAQLTKRGYLLVDVDPQRVVGEWWYVDTALAPSNVETFAVAFEVRQGTNHLVPSVQTASRVDPPALAPWKEPSMQPIAQVHAAPVRATHVRVAPVRAPARVFRLAALAAALGLAGVAEAANLVVAGNLVYNTDVVRIDFTLAAPGSVTLWTDSWNAGLNFDPELALFDASFVLSAVGDDTPDPSALLPGQGGYDSQLRFAALAAGTYHLALTASGNDPLGPTYAAGFSLAGTPPIPIPLWNQPSYDLNRNDQKGTAWTVHLDGVTSIAAVPEPASWALLAAGIGVAFVLAGRRRRD